MKYAYNPKKKSFDQLQTSLVGSHRIAAIDNLMSELTLKRGQSPKQHWMFVGPRGIGKSHLLTLLYHKVKSDAKTSAIWLPVLFPEELRMVGNLAAFIERALDEIINALDIEKHPACPELKEKKAKARQLAPDKRLDYLFDLLSWTHETTGRFLLFITENLQQLLGKKIKIIEQKKLRAFLQSDNSVLFIGSATTIFNALSDHSHPFYHFFYIKRLQEIGFEDMETMINRILANGNTENNKGTINDNRSRLKALYSFTGGNPRMAVFIADILKAGAPDEMVTFMDNLIDELNPYFENIFNDVPQCNEEILNALAAFEPAQSPKEIAEHLELPQNSVRNYLKNLKENGYIRIAFSKGKSNYYCLNEYLYRIWFQMRDSVITDQASWLVELLVVLYSRNKIIEEKGKFEVNRFDNNLILYKRLFAQSLKFMDSKPDHCRILNWCVESQLRETEAEYIYKDPGGCFIGKFIGALNENKPDKAVNAFIQMVATSSIDVDFLTNITVAIFMLLDSYEKISKKLEKKLASGPGAEQPLLTLGLMLIAQSRYDEAIEIIEKTIGVNPDSCIAYAEWGHCLARKGENKGAIEKFCKSIKINAELVWWFTVFNSKFVNFQSFTINVTSDNRKGVYKSITNYNINPRSVICNFTQSLLEVKHYEQAIGIMISCSDSVVHLKKLCCLNLDIIEKINDKENAIIGYINGMRLIKHIWFIEYLNVYNNFVQPVVKTLKFDILIKDFYNTELNKSSVRIKCGTMFLLLNKYEVVGDHLADIINKSTKEKSGNRALFDIFVFTIKLTMLLKLGQGAAFETLKLAGFYTEYIKSMETVHEKEKTVSEFVIDIFRLYSSGKANPETIQNILDMLEAEQDVPFNNILRNIWTCISEPDTVEAQRYLNEKPIAAIVNEIKKDAQPANEQDTLVA